MVWEALRQLSKRSIWFWRENTMPILGSVSYALFHRPLPDIKLILALH